MRISVRKHDSGYHQQAYLCKVLLDGKELSNCFTADEEKGEAHCIKLDGRHQELKIKTGKVEIIKPENFKEILRN